MASIRIFAAGSHRGTNGEQLTFSAGDVAAIAAAYDPDKHQAPVVKGHPTNDAPAYGWVDGLTDKDGELFAEVGDMDEAVKADVGAGRYRYVSSAFYRPTDAGNPTPGKWHLRHVGLLGAVPPAVKGLGRVQFDDGGEFVDVAFGERPGLMADALHRISWAFSGIASALRGQRERAIDDQGMEAADKAVPAWQVDQLSEAAAELRSLARTAEGNAPPARFSETPDPNPDNDFEEDPVTNPDPKALQAEIDRLTKDNAALTRAEAERVANAAHAGNVAFCDALVKDAKLPQGQVETVVSLLDHLAAAKADKPVAFSDADGKTIEPVDALKNLLSGLAPKVAFGEMAAGDEAPAVAFSLPAGEGFAVAGPQLELHAKAIAYQRQHNVDYAAAIAAVGG